MKPYRVIAKIQNNRLWQAIIEVYPTVRNQSDAAHVLDLHPTILGLLLNMKKWPARIHEKSGTIIWQPTAKKIADLTAQLVEYLFDPAYYGIHVVNAPKMISLELGIKEIESANFALLPPTSDEIVETLKLDRQVETLLATLSPREQSILRERMSGKTLREIGENHFIGPERVRGLEQRSLKRMNDEIKRRKKFL